MKSASGRISFGSLFHPRAYATLIGAGVFLISCLALRGDFAHSSRYLHQIAWGVVGLGMFGWMGSVSESNPNPKRGAGICLLQYLLLAVFLSIPVLSSDGDFYYGITRTMLWNRDLNTMEEGARFSNSWMVERAAEGSAHGFPYHPFPIGVSLLWIPFIGMGHIQATIKSLFDPTLTLNGYSKPYLDWLSIGTATIGAGFAIFGHFLLRLRFDHQISKRAIIGTLLATPGAFYCFRDMGFPHAASMASIACFLWVWLRDPDRIDWKQIFLLSVPLSISALVRWQNSLFALAPVVYWLSLFPHGADPLRGLSQKITRILGLGALCFVFCLPQLLIFRLRGPSWLSLQHGGPEEFSWSTPKFFSLAFDDRYGLLFWHPFYFLCGLGGVLYLSRGVNWRTLLWIGGFAVWCWTAFLAQ
ncbi:MAG: hypothetical protein H6752_14105, partial [Candidatus Omnitrophica bacterium]|nr:hypothetical protein [Candidatus Omnitrophota bacterium]